MCRENTSSYDISELEDSSIAVDATYYLSQLLDGSPAHEPLLSALGGLTGIETHINQNLDLWENNRIVPFFVFDGQSVTGQDEVSLQRRLLANKKTDEAWDLYSRSEAERAVHKFGTNPGPSIYGSKLFSRLVEVEEVDKRNCVLTCCRLL